MFKKNLIFLFLIIYVFNSLKAQNPEIDTLIKELNIQKNKEIKTDLLKKISLKYSENNQYLKSNEYAERALKILPKKDLFNKIYFWNILSENLIKLSKFEKGIIYIDKILDNTKKINDKHYEGVAYQNLMKIYCKQGKYDKAAKAGIKSSDIFEKLNDTENSDIITLNIALIYIDLRNFKEADKIFDEFISKKNQKDTLLIAGIYEKKVLFNFIKIIFHQRDFTTKKP